MKAISINQPWANLVTLGHKKSLNRIFSTDYRGELLIHAPKTWNAVQNSLCCRQSFKSLLNGSAEFIQTKYGEKCVMPLGAIVGKVVITDITELHNPKAMNKAVSFEEYPFGKFQWHFSQAEIFAKPVPTNGKFWLWEYEDMRET